MNLVAEAIIDESGFRLWEVVQRIWIDRWRFPNFHSDVADLSQHHNEFIRAVASVLGDDAEIAEFRCPHCRETQRFRCIDTSWPILRGITPFLPDGYPHELGDPSRMCLCEICANWSFLVLFPGLEDGSLATKIEKSQRALIEHRLSLRIRIQNILASEGILSVEHLCRMSAQSLMEYRHMTPELLDEIRMELARIGLTLRGESGSRFEENLERFLQHGEPDFREVLHFCREHIRERPNDESHVLAVMSASDISDVRKAVTALKRWLAFSNVPSKERKMSTREVAIRLLREADNIRDSAPGCHFPLTKVPAPCAPTGESQTVSDDQRLFSLWQCAHDYNEGNGHAVVALKERFEDVMRHFQVSKSEFYQ